MIENISNINNIGAIPLISIKDHKQGYLLDPWDYVGPKRRRRMEESWAGFFQREILCKLPTDKFAKAFTSDFGRPTKELHTILGVLLLQQMHDLTDEETVDQAAFNLQWHYALNIPEESDEAKYICLKTLWSMRKAVTDMGLDMEMFTNLTDTLATLFKVDMSNSAWTPCTSCPICDTWGASAFSPAASISSLLISNASAQSALPSLKKNKPNSSTAISLRRPLGAFPW
jgi:Transposase domain (DUF772).